MAKKKTTKELVEQLKKIKAEGHGDHEHDHVEADRALLAFIGNPDVTDAFDAITKWYA